MEGLTKKIVNNKIILDYNSVFDSKKTPEPVSFSSAFDLFKYRKDLAGLLKNNFAILEGIYDKVEISPNGNVGEYNIILSTSAKQILLHSKDPYKDLFL